MSIGPDSPWRGCAATLPQPVTEEDKVLAQYLVEHVSYFNCRVAIPPLKEIEYRSSSRDHDLTHHVFRWDRTPYEQVFVTGFQARPEGDTSEETYYNIVDHVNNGGRPLYDNEQRTPHGFIGTTLNSSWHPNVNPGVEEKVYRYEIYAPGGIWVAETLGPIYRYPSQNEVCFVQGIAPQYIRSAQAFWLRGANGMWTRRQRVDDILIINGCFNPQQYPPRFIYIRRPIFDYYTEQGDRRKPLKQITFRPQLPKRVKAAAGQEEEEESLEEALYDLGDMAYTSETSSVEKWYAQEVADTKTYITAAFRASATNEAYLFMKNEYVLVNYAPGSTNDRVINGPLLICDGYHSLIGTTFGEDGIDSAFETNDGENEAYIFSGNLCAHINYAPGSTNDRILRGPMTITSMFRFFKKTVFERGIDAAFEATTTNEAYLFKEDQYALIDYNAPRLIAIRRIIDGFFSLRNTIFESGIDAAFASHRRDEAYLFKEDSYALINFAPGTTNDRIIGGIKKIIPHNWPSLASVLPRNNRGIDVHHHDA